MKRCNLWIGLVLIMISALGLGACASELVYEKIEPAELIDQGDGRNLVILTERAAERIGVETDSVREEQFIQTRTVGGEFIADANNPEQARVRVRISDAEFASVNTSRPAFVLSLDDEEDDDMETGWMAELDELPGLDDPEDTGIKEMHYVIKNADHNLVAGQKLLVELSLMGGDAVKLVVPVGALVYDLNGETWIYISPEPLHFLRYPVQVDYIEGDMVVLLEGPPVGTKVATVGVPELHGTDTGVGK
jgi:multidrug efflux pump subunit AcrA (membrane-fusion protein)